MILFLIVKFLVLELKKLVLIYISDIIVIEFRLLRKLSGSISHTEMLYSYF